MRRYQPRPNPRTLAVCFLGLLSLAAPLSADIYEWEYIDPLGFVESSTLVPDGAGLFSVPGADFSGKNLRKAYLIGADLKGANFEAADLTQARLDYADLTHANLMHMVALNTVFANANMFAVDSRGAAMPGFPGPAANMQNFITRNGVMLDGLVLSGDEYMLIRDDDGRDSYAPIYLRVRKDFNIDSDSILRFLFEDPEWGSIFHFETHVALDPVGTAYFGGTLELAMKLDEGLSPVDLLDATFQLFDWTGVTLDGWFDDVVIDPAWFAAGLGFDLSQLQTSGVVRVVSLIGDLDGDGFVGIADLNIILANWNQAVTPGSLLSGDLSGDGFVGIEDLNTVLGTWNDSVPPPGIGSSVPEPAGAVLLGIGVAVTAGRRRII